MANAAVVLNQQQTIVNQAAQNLTTNGNSSSFDASGFNQLLVALNFTNYAGPGIVRVYLDGLGPDNAWYQLYEFADVNGNYADIAALVPSTAERSQTATGFAGMVMPTLRLRWVLNGATVTLAYWIMGQSV